MEASPAGLASTVFGPVRRPFKTDSLHFGHGEMQQAQRRHPSTSTTHDEIAQTIIAPLRPAIASCNALTAAKNIGITQSDQASLQKPSRPQSTAPYRHHRSCSAATNRHPDDASGPGSAWGFPEIGKRLRQ